MKFFALLTLGFLSLSLQSAYRVYQYQVRAKNPFSFDYNNYIVTSTLDPISYIAYHGGGNSLKIDLLRSWTCKGHTGHKKQCLPPLEEISKGF